MQLPRRTSIRASAVVSFLLAGWTAGCGGNAADANARGSDDSPSEKELPRLVEAPCRYPIHPSQTVGETVHCADLFVASRRDGAPASEYRLHVVRFGPQTPRPDPVVFLTGGPGQDLLLTDAPLELSTALAAERDFVQITQRGIGAVEPLLDCPALSELPPFQGDDPEGYEALEASAVRGCRDGFVEAGIDLAAFSTRELAGDVEDLRAALGVTQVVLTGASYGSLWALEVMRRYPTSVRATVIDSIVAPSLVWTLQAPRGLQTALERLFDYCNDDPACAPTFGEGYPLLQQAFAALEAEPLTLPTTGLTLNATDLGQILFTAMYDYTAFGLVPLVLALAAERDGETLEAVLEPIAASLLTMRFSASVQQFSVWCSDAVQYSDEGDIDAAHAGVWPEISRTFRSGDERLLALCSQWPSAPAESLAPVVSDIPTLIGNGEMDPVTPDTSAELVARTLSNSRFLRIPRVGHAGVTAVCGLAPVYEFVETLDADALDLSCNDAAPAIEFITGE